MENMDEKSCKAESQGVSDVSRYSFVSFQNIGSISFSPAPAGMTITTQTLTSLVQLQPDSTLP